MKHYLTKERFEKLKTDLRLLKTESRTEIAERLKRAKEYGDLSENAEYSEAKEAQAHLENQILKLEETVRNAVIIKKTGEKDIVSVGSTIEVKKKGKIFKYTIVGSSEAQPEINLISNESPIGRAFLEKKAGDIVKIQTPGGLVDYEIIKIE